MTNNTDILVRRFVDGDLTAEEEAEALRRIADSPDARALLRFERRLGEELSANRPSSVPADFAKRTMAAVRAEGRNQMITKSKSGSWIDWLWDLVVRPRSITVRPAYGLVTAVVLVIALGMLLGRPAPEVVRPAAESSTTTAVANTENTNQQLIATRFTYVDNEASSVAVAGDFNEWNPDPLKPRMVDGQRVWTGVIPLREGEHQYMFVIDGEEWVTDPLAPVQREDGFGHRNAVISL